MKHKINDLAALLAAMATAIGDSSGELEAVPIEGPGYAAMRLRAGPIRATPGRCRQISSIAISSILYATWNWRLIGLKLLGETKRGLIIH